MVASILFTSVRYEQASRRGRDAGNVRELAAGEHKQPSDENGFGNLAVFVGRGLEGLARRVGEAVQVEAIVPIGAADERQAMGPRRSSV